MSKNIFKPVSLLGAVLFLLVSFNNCGQVQQPDLSLLSSQSGVCNTSNVNEYMSSPTNIEMVVDLINALPKPLTIDCFISALKKPLKVYSVNNSFSLQPALNIDNPRIFIIFGNFTMSVVPAGTGMRLLEVSQLVSTSQSVKGEFVFPIERNLAQEDPYVQILNDGGTTTKCMGCHSGESRNPNILTGPAFNSNVTRPDPMKRVLQSYMLYQSKVCGSRGSPVERCKMLKAIFQDGEAEDIENFP